jgi:prevent-host-death family protein
VNVKIDLKRGVVPISKAAATIAALLRRSRQEQGPIIITQKGYPTGVLLDVDVYLKLVEQAGQPAPDLAPAEV